MSSNEFIRDQTNSLFRKNNTIILHCIHVKIIHRHERVIISFTKLQFMANYGRARLLLHEVILLLYW